MNIINSINILSVFDGMSCGQIALKQMGVKINKYYAAEVDKFAIAQTQLNFPNTIQLGSVVDVKAKDLEKIDLFIGGSPCQGFSFAGKQLNFDDPRSKLFFEFVRLWNEIKEINPKAKFLLENVNMKKEHMRVISEHMGLFPVRINSNLLSAQNRDRWYWTNIRTKNVGLFSEVWSDIPQPKDKGILLKDILQDESEIDEKYYLSEKAILRLLNNGEGFHSTIKKSEDKTSCLGAMDYVKLARGMNAYGIQFSPTGNTSISDRFFSENGKHGALINSSTKSKTGIIQLNKSTERVCAAMRGRGENNEQQLEPRDDNKTNALTSVSKDNLVIQLNKSTESGGKQPYQQNRVYDKNGISPALLTDARSPLIGFTRYTNDFKLRRLTPTECARLQTIPEWYVWECSDTQQYKMLGNGWTIDVITHIFSTELKNWQYNG